jgi:hypothetical protein
MGETEFVGAFPPQAGAAMRAESVRCAGGVEPDGAMVTIRQVSATLFDGLDL